VARIVNVVVLIPNQFAYRPLHAISTTKTTAADMLNLYTWFPFKFGRCGEVHDVILLHKWVLESNGRFSENAHLYSTKVPKNFMGCPIKVGSIGVHTFVIMTKNSTQNNGSTAYKMTGLYVEILKFVCDQVKLTAVFLPPSPYLEQDSVAKQLDELKEGLSDVLTGIVPPHPVVETSSFDATIPYSHMIVKMLVPCPKAFPAMEKLLTTFSLSVWFTIGLVLLLTTAVFWCASNVP
jgi:hypothetical protein